MQYFDLQKPSCANGHDSIQTASNSMKADVIPSGFFDFNKSLLKEERATDINEASAFWPR
jgi:hypothetical protein